MTIRTDLDLSWIDDWTNGIATKGAKIPRQKAPGAKRAPNDGDAAKKVRTPGDAAIDLEEQIDDNEKHQLQRPNEGKNPGKGDKKRILKGGHGTE